MFHGSIVALVTPFRNGVVDEDAFQRLVERHLAEGTHGFVPVGTTGESPTLSHAEHERVVELCVEAVAGRRPVIAGTGSNATEEAISLTRHAKKAGADAALVVTPYYNRPTQEGLYAHYQGDPGRGGPADHHLQHPGTLGGGDDGRDHGAAGAGCRTSSVSRIRPPTSCARS